MRKDVKVVVAGACLLLIGLLAYVLFLPASKKAEVVTDETVAPADSGTKSAVTPEAAPITVTVATTQPTGGSVATTVTPAAGPATQPSIAAVVPSTDSNVAVGTVSGGATDWVKTLNTGTLASGPAHSQQTGLTTLIGSTGSDTTTLASPTTRPAQLATTGGRTHKVVFGETLSSIAAEYYGNSANYPKIAAANPSVNINRLKPGTVLTIPDLKSTGEESAKPAADKLVAGSANTYAVKSGDSLQRIASRLYGSADKWQKIYELNKSAIGSDPHRLKAGMVLKLPEGANTSSAAAH